MCDIVRPTYAGHRVREAIQRRSYVPVPVSDDDEEPVMYNGHRVREAIQRPCRIHIHIDSEDDRQSSGSPMPSTPPTPIDHEIIDLTNEDEECGVIDLTEDDTDEKEMKKIPQSPPESKVRTRVSIIKQGPPPPPMKGTKNLSGCIQELSSPTIVSRKRKAIIGQYQPLPKRRMTTRSMTRPRRSARLSNKRQ
jgi:hypothetical protein